jgi:hypothetical protein
MYAEEIWRQRTSPDLFPTAPSTRRQARPGGRPRARAPAPQRLPGLCYLSQADTRLGLLRVYRKTACPRYFTETVNQAVPGK